MLGKNFVDRCLESEILSDPWPHTVTENHIDQDEFANLRQQCEKLLDIKMSDMPTFKGQTENQIQPKRFKEFGIDWYDQILEISQNIFDICCSSFSDKTKLVINKFIYSSPSTSLIIFSICR